MTEPPSFHGTIVSAPAVDPPGRCTTGAVVGMSNVSGELRLLLETEDHRFVWCRASDATVTRLARN